MAIIKTDRPSPASSTRTPVMATQAVGMTHPHIEATPSFLYTFHPERWMVLDGQLVPALQKVPLVAGVNGVEVDKDGRVHFARARASLEQQGRTVIPWEWAPDGESYLQCVETRPDGGVDVAEAWISVWESADLGSRRTNPDESSYVAWLRSLIDQGRLPMCSPAVVGRMLDDARRRLAEAEATAAKNAGHGSAALRAEAIRAEVETLTRYASEMRAERAPSKRQRKPVVDDAPGAA